MTIDDDPCRISRKRLVDEERETSYRRCFMTGRIGLSRVDPVQHGGLSLSPREIAHTIMGGEIRIEEGF